MAPSSGATVLGVTCGVAHHPVPDASRPRDPPGRQSRSPPSGSMSPSFASRSNYGIRPYVQSIMQRSPPEFSLRTTPTSRAALRSASSLPGPMHSLSVAGARSSVAWVLERSGIFERINRLYVQSRYFGLVPLDAPARRHAGRWGLRQRRRHRRDQRITDGLLRPSDNVPACPALRWRTHDHDSPGQGRLSTSSGNRLRLTAGPRKAFCRYAVNLSHPLPRQGIRAPPRRCPWKGSPTC